MSEEQRINRINAAALKYLEVTLESMEAESLDEEDFLAKTYASLIATKLLGYDPSDMAKDAEAAAQRLLDLTAEEE